MNNLNHYDQTLERGSELRRQSSTCEMEWLMKFRGLVVAAAYSDGITVQVAATHPVFISLVRTVKGPWLHETVISEKKKKSAREPDMYVGIPS